MVKQIPDLEVFLKKQAIKMHQEVIGKGPKEVWVKIHRNVATICSIGSLTHYELYLLRLENGKEMINELRRMVCKSLNSMFSRYIEETAGLKVSDVCWSFSINCDTLICNIIFNEDLEDRYINS